ncbi:hypothetical protein ACSVBT_18625 [Afipia sp. TerB]
MDILNIIGPRRFTRAKRGRYGLGVNVTRLSIVNGKAGSGSKHRRDVEHDEFHDAANLARHGIGCNVRPLLKRADGPRSRPFRLSSQAGCVSMGHDRARDLTAPPLVAIRLMQRPLVNRKR